MTSTAPTSPSQPVRPRLQPQRSACLVVGCRGRRAPASLRPSGHPEARGSSGNPGAEREAARASRPTTVVGPLRPELERAGRRHLRRSEAVPSRTRRSPSRPVLRAVSVARNGADARRLTWPTMSKKPAPHGPPTTARVSSPRQRDAGRWYCSMASKTSGRPDASQEVGEESAEGGVTPGKPPGAVCGTGRQSIGPGRAAGPQQDCVQDAEGRRVGAMRGARHGGTTARA
jgi:hypothetical protein